MAVTHDLPSRTAGALPDLDRKRFAHVEKFVAEHLPTGNGRPVYDSVVIAGGKGITAWALAARLARSEQFAGKVVIAGAPVEETRQIANGASMRGLAADFLCYALQCSHADLIRQFAGTHQAGQPVATRQVTTMATLQPDGVATFGPAATWQGSRRGLGRPLMYGGRNSRVANSLRELLDASGIIETDQAVTSLAEARELAPGRNPLLVNLTRNPKLFGAAAPPIKRYTFAWQVPLKVGAAGLKHPLTGTSAFAPLVHRDGAIDVGYFTPFADPASPEATWYGLMVKPARGTEHDKEREIAALRAEVLGVAAGVGMEPVDEAETAFGGQIPAPPFGAAPRPAAGTLEMRRLCTPGAVAYYADGIVGGAIGAVMAAEALIRGADPHEAIVGALKRIRLYNDVWWFETTRIPFLVNAAVGTSRLTTRIALGWPHTYSTNDWASYA